MAEQKRARGLDDLPTDGSIDASVALLREGYDFIRSRCDRLQSDAFRTRLMLRTAVCLSGPRWTHLLYGSEGLTRVGAMPSPILRLLQDKGSVQQLEGAEHRHRKTLFTGMLLDEARVSELTTRFRQVWLKHLPAWTERGEVCLLTAVSALLAEAACDWAGLELSRDELDATAAALFRMVDQAGRPRIATLAALRERRGVERRLKRVVGEARTDGTRSGTPLGQIAAFRDADGRLLSRDVATVELINFLRPIVAVGRYIVFLAMRLHQEPQWRERLGTDDELLEPFCEELRRCAPFFPMTAAITTEQVEWEGLVIPKNQWLLFDLHGTLRDPACFADPRAFRPDRQLSWRSADECFVPQGGGDVHTTHRCPGEMATVALMVEAARLLTRDIVYQVPEQDLGVRPNRVPAQPESGFVIRSIQSRGGRDGDGSTACDASPLR